MGEKAPLIGEAIEDTATAAEKKPAPSTEDTAAGKKPAPCARDKPAPYMEKPSPYLEEKASPYLEEKPLLHVEKKASLHVEDKASPYLEEKPSLHVEDKASPYLEEKPSLHVEDKASLHVEDKPSPYVEEKPSLHVEDKASPYVEDKPSPYVEKKPAWEDKNPASAGKKPAPYVEEKPAGEEELVDTADLPVDMVLAVAARLPSKAVGRAAVLSKTYGDRLREPSFLMSHLAPRNRFFPGDTEPSTIVLQPAAQGVREGYTHLTVIVVRPRGFILHDMPVRSADDEDGGYYDYYIDDIDHTAGPQPVRRPTSFFSDTVPGLDLRLLASEGRLLVAHSPTHGVFICNANEDRCIRLPTPPLGCINGHHTTAALRYKLGDWGEIDEFDVVLLSSLPSGRVALQSFSAGGGGHGDGVWVLTEITDDSVLAALTGVSAPGIYAGEADSFYWIDNRNGSLIEYVLQERLLSLVPPPPEVDGYPSRIGWSLGSTGGLPRITSFNAPVPDHGFAEIHDINGVLSVWIKSQTGWVMVKEVVVQLAWSFVSYRGLEVPVDVSRANGDLLMVKKDQELLWRDLKRDEVEFVSNLHLRTDSELSAMYSRFNAFSV